MTAIRKHDSNSGANARASMTCAARSPCDSQKLGGRGGKWKKPTITADSAVRGKPEQAATGMNTNIEASRGVQSSRNKMSSRRLEEQLANPQLYEGARMFRW